MFRPLLVSLGLLCFSGMLFADHERPFTLLVGFNPGGSMSQQAEVVAEVLSEQLDQPVELLYFSGVGGGAAAAMLAAGQPDGRLIQFSPSLTFTFSPLSVSSSFDVDSFDYLAAVSRDQLALISRTYSPYQSWEELLAFAHQEGELVFASQTQLDRLLIGYLAKKEGIKVRIVPTSGGRESLMLVLSGEVDLAFGGGAYLEEVKKGKIQALLALSQTPLSALPEVATLESAGYSLGFESMRVFAVAANTPAEYRKQLVAALAKLVEDPRFLAVTENVLQMPVVFKTGDDLNQFMYRQNQAIDRILEFREKTHVQ